MVVNGILFKNGKSLEYVFPYTVTYVSLIKNYVINSGKLY